MANLQKFQLLFIAILIICLPSSCSKLSYPNFQSTTNPPTNKFWAGAAAIDITPPPGYPMAGFGLIGKYSRGFWSRLYSKAHYFEDRKGNQLVIVSCDLWSISAGLVDEVINLLHEGNIPDLKIGRENLILTATHTHHGQACISTNIAFNLGLAVVPGFDKPLYSFTAQKIAKSIIEAYQHRVEASLSVHKSSIEGLVRNRSVEAFKQNSTETKDSILKYIHNPDQYFNANLPPFVESSLAFKALNPELITLKIFPKNKNSSSEPIAIMNFTAFHSTVMGSQMELNSADIFGAAAIELKNQCGYDNTIVSFINGAEGDLSANWYQQDKWNTLSLGKKISSRIIQAIQQPGHEISGEINNRIQIIPLAGQKVTIDKYSVHVDCIAGGKFKTAMSPYPGLSSFGGTEDGKLADYNLGIREGLTMDYCHVTQGRKINAVIHILKSMAPIDPKGFGRILLETIGTAYLTSIAPKEAPIGIHNIGNFGMVCLPGEFTTVLGEIIHNKVYKNLNLNTPDLDELVLIGLANDYLSYFTTPPEFNAQHYEGAATLYGTLSGIHLVQSIEKLSAQIPKLAINKKRKFNPGPKFKKWYYNECKPDFWSWKQSLSNLMQDPETGEPVKEFPFFIWKDKIPTLYHTKDFANLNVLPNVSIEYFDENENHWKILVLNQKNIHGNLTYQEEQSDINSLKFMTSILDCDEGQGNWITVWMVSKNLNLIGKKLRFVVKKIDGGNIHSSNFEH